jgi:nucleoside-diphosphate-sugar epimerase
MPVLFPPGDTIPNGTLLIDLMKVGRGQISSAMTVPTILEDITTLPNFSNAASYLSELDFIAVGGGGIKHTVGAKLHSHNVALVNHFGATELGALAPIFLPDSSYDWRYLRLRRDMGLKLERIEPEPSSSLVRTLTGFPFGWGKSFQLQDRLEVNPLCPDGEVAILGRNDDLIVLATGEKVLPFLIERSLEAHPMIKRAVAFGNGQFEIGVIVEPFKYTLDSKSKFVDIVWAEVIRANKLGDQHAQVAKQSIIIKPEHKNIPLTDKGSVRRKEVDTIFHLEIEAVYSRLSMSDAEDSSTVFDVVNPWRSVEELVHACLPSHVAPESMKADTDFILTGMDSLRITRLRRRIESSLRKAGLQHDIPRDIIYSYPNIAGLTAALTGWLRGSISESNPIEDMISTANRYIHTEPRVISQPSEVVVLVTGTTGNLGANLVQQLASNCRVGRVVCMVRQSSIPVGMSKQEALIERQKAALEERGVVLSAERWLKIEMLSWIPGAEFLGLGGAEFNALARRVTHVFHGAWPMDFKLSLNSLEPHIKALQDLIELVRLAYCFNPSRKCRIVLASSIAVVGRYQQKRVPEVIMQDPQATLPLGYARAKWVCEKMMESAYQHIAGISPVVLRIGQMSGATTTGFWSHKEHFPALIKCSQIVGGLPVLNGVSTLITSDTPC